MVGAVDPTDTVVGDNVVAVPVGFKLLPLPQAARTNATAPTTPTSFHRPIIPPTMFGCSINLSFLTDWFGQLPGTAGLFVEAKGGRGLGGIDNRHKTVVSTPGRPRPALCRVAPGASRRK